MIKLSQELDILSKYGNLPEEIPNYVVSNLNPKFKLREYQKEALRRFHFYMEDFQGRVKPTQLLYHMATGSGKTLIMSANILYLYERDYQNFIFFVNSTNIIEKTKDNFLNPHSIKYLFDESINFGTKNVKVKEVENFEGVNKEDINILFTTIQGLHIHLNEPRENTITYEDFKNKKIVLISDEAHHINTLTKSRLNESEKDEMRSWEGTVNRIFKSNPDNILLEYTATANLDHPRVQKKYEDKILFQYTLKEFRLDSFSKEVKVLEADLPPIERALQAIVVSQYRRKIAEKHKILLKPVLLFKSNYVNPPLKPGPNKVVSKEFKEKFLQKIKYLTELDLQEIKSKVKSGIVKDAFDYFEKEGINFNNLIKELQEDFSEEKIISIDSRSESEEKQILVNSLEDPDNQIRAVFAVEKLNEGWDVLNLFDIVRLYNTRDARRGKPGKTTISEAQLIGRGARYYPFRLDESQELYKRKYDQDLDNNLRVLEELYYHSAYNPRYIQELKTALRETGIIPQRTKEIQLKVKDSFKKSEFWKNAIIFLNKKIRNDRLDILSLSDNIEFKTEFKYNLRTGYSKDLIIFDNSEQLVIEKDTEVYKISDFDTHVIRKALNKIDFFKFSNLKAYFHHLSSINEFINSDKFLGIVKVEVTGSSDRVKNLSNNDKLEITISLLKKLAKNIKECSYEYIGTKEFKPFAASHIVKDKTLNVAIDENSDKEYGIPMSNPKNPDLQLDLNKKNWYVYNENYGTTEEKYLVKFIDLAIDKLKQKYSDIFLIRNSKLFQLYRFSDGAAIEPDFVLFLKEKKTNKTLIYQLFIEAKGEHLIATDKWKEDFLKGIENEYRIEVIFENKDYKLFGMPFYNESLKREFEKKFNEILKGCNSLN